MREWELGDTANCRGSREHAFGWGGRVAIWHGGEPRCFYTCTHASRLYICLRSLDRLRRYGRAVCRHGRHRRQLRHGGDAATSNATSPGGSAGNGGDLATGNSTSTSGGSGAAEQQIVDSLQTFTSQNCAKLSSCSAVGDSVTCQAGIAVGVSAIFLGKGEACAQLGLEYMNCLDSLACDQMVAGAVGTCMPDSQKLAASCATGSSTTTSDPTAQLINCTSADVSAADSSEVGAIVCNAKVSNCDDGHAYSLMCIYQAPGTSICACSQDGSFKSVFTTDVSQCPSVDIVNAACAWNLAGI